MSTWMILVLVFHVFVTIGLVAVILLQRSEGGGLGIGGGTSGGLMTARGAANLLTRLTSILAAVFIANSILLAVMAGYNRSSRSQVEELLQKQATDAPAAVPDSAPIAGSAPALPAAPAATGGLPISNAPAAQPEAQGEGTTEQPAAK